MDTKGARRRMLCSEIVSLHLPQDSGGEREVKANLEEIWSSGAILWTDVSIRQCSSLWFPAGGFEFRGKVSTRRLLRGLGCMIEIQFHPGCRWSQQKYRPKHLFNPLVLLANRVFETTLYSPRSPFDRVRLAFVRPAVPSTLKAAFGS